MTPRTLLDSAAIPGGGELRLYRRGGEFSIMLGGNELMSSRVSGSEQALATLACERIAARRAPSLLVGGLGMGFTLRAALDGIGPDGRVTVVEIVPQVIAWARGPMAEIFAGCLDDPRVAIVEADVGMVLRADRSAHDAILLDVDNGPDGITREGNDRLYDTGGLAAAHAALRAGGVLAVWSAAPDPRFTARLRRAGFDVEQVVSRANGARGGARHTIWLAEKRGAG